MVFNFGNSPNSNRDRDMVNTYSYNNAMQSPTVSRSDENAVQNADGTFSYSETVDHNAVYKKGIQEKQTTKMPATAVGVWGITMGQTQNFTLDIPDLTSQINNYSFKMPSATSYITKSGGSVYQKQYEGKGKFLPVKSIDYKTHSAEHKVVKAGSIQDLPFFYQMKLGSITLSLLDDSKSNLSFVLYNYWASACSDNGVVYYLDDLAKECIYSEYSHDGNLAIRYSFYVIPTGDIQVTRKYETENGELTEYRCTLKIVSGVSHEKGGYIGEGGEADWGSGGGPRASYERRVSGVAFIENGPNMYINDPAIADYL